MANARKIPYLRLILGILALATPVSAQAPDTVRIFHEANRAEMEYESRVRRLAPLSLRPAGGTCDEQVGRYCLTFETNRDTLPTEPAGVREARDTAIARLARAARIVPERSRFVCPLVRQLVIAGRAADAIPFARAYARATGNKAFGHMVLGYVLHAANQAPEAERALAAWLAALSVRERERVTSLEWLIDPAEWQRVRHLPREERERYEAKLWRFSDPLYLTGGNEMWRDHIARHALARLLERRRGYGDSWGRDAEELTVRFGATVLTTRSWGPGSIGLQEQLAEHWDPAARTYIPLILDSALAMQARIDSLWPLDTLIARTGHAPPPIRAMRVLQHQATRFGDHLLVHGSAPTGPTVTEAPVGAVFVLDSALNVVAKSAATPCFACAPADSAVLTAELRLPAEAVYYSAELFDPASGFAARARYRLPEAGRVLSGALLAEPFPPGRLPQDRASGELRPLARPAVTTGSRFGLYMEVRNRLETRDSARLELEMRPLDRPSAIGRAIAWVGEKLGLSAPETPARMSWIIELAPARTTAVPITLDAGSLEPGRYQILVRVTADGIDDVVTREFAVVSPASSSSPPP